ncbi:hypothetical protein E2C01_027902 [Portunus trituberculatus]|uniref:Uncharacterized protein n=1 Tax=Portunus trituberculatus TaxID=210409 RepID=A0A5B7EJ43_PORTR|nr:hypothetical protein [Portunus trituberculatus]
MSTSAARTTQHVSPHCRPSNRHVHYLSSHTGYLSPPTQFSYASSTPILRFSTLFTRYFYSPTRLQNFIQYS